MTDPEKTTAGQLLEALLSEWGKVIIGKPETLRSVLISLLCRGHLLLEDLPGLGKTTLANKLLDPNYQLGDLVSTKGIDIHQLQLPSPQQGDAPFQMHIWDFGGQEIYKATHQFFLSTRVLYALVIDQRRQDDDLDY